MSTTEIQPDQTHLTTVEWKTIPDQGTTAWLHIVGK
jgi:hypothetical protein